MDIAVETFRTIPTHSETLSLYRYKFSTCALHFLVGEVGAGVRERLFKVERL